MATVYLLIGLPASGKSTWRAKHLAANPDVDTVVCSSDDFIDEYAADHGITYDEAFGKLNFKDLKARLRNRFRQAINAGQDVIVDRTNMNAKARKEFLKNLPDVYRTVGVVFVVPDNVLKERMAARHAATGKSVPEDVLADMAKRYQSPLPGEFDQVIYVRD